MANKLNKQDIEAIYPLSITQQGLLFHSLSNTFDQGFLNLQCDIKGSIDPNIFEEAWNLIIQRHAIMRTTVHWQNIEKPVQIVHKKKIVVPEFFDWTSYSTDETEKKWEDLKNQNRANGVDFVKGALLQVKLVTFELETHKLLWTNHHLLLDGWSSNIILKEVFSCYKALINKTEPSFEPLPSYKSYLRWSGQKKPEDAELFWTDYFKGLQKTSIVGSIAQNTTSETSEVEHRFTEPDSIGLKKYAQRNKVTLNTVIQGIWSLVLCRYFDSKDVVHGTTVSGRTSDFVNMDLLTGMYSKVHPVRNLIESDKESLTQWFEKIQQRQSKASTFEYLDLEDIMNYVDKDLEKPLFDSLLIFENYPVVETQDDGVVVSNFKSGVTSTYPFTIVILPGDEMSAVLRVSENNNQEDKAQWLLETFHRIVKLIVSDEVTTLVDIESKINPYQNHDESPVSDNIAVQDNSSASHVAPKNEVEKQLVQIWEDVFGTTGIGVQDNFFEIGGKSILAVKLFTAINAKMETKLYPTTLLEHPTVASLASIFTKETKTEDYKYIVPINSSGTKSPLFCVHGGGAHVFFFNPLAKALGADRPVYALQPSGMYDQDSMHKSIAAMGRDYAEEVRKVQPEGPYNILVYCFSTAVGIEMALTWKKYRQDTNMIIIDSLIDQENFTDPTRIKARIKGFLKRTAKNPFKALKMGYKNHVQEFLDGKRIARSGTEEEKNLERVKNNLIEIYNDYGWQTAYQGQLSLLLTEKDDKGLNTLYLKNWETITEQEVTVLNIHGEHHQLFEEPMVVPMAKTVDSQII